LVRWPSWWNKIRVLYSPPLCSLNGTFLPLSTIISNDCPMPGLLDSDDLVPVPPAAHLLWPPPVDELSGLVRILWSRVPSTQPASVSQSSFM
jgi:hypothetical protein